MDLGKFKIHLSTWNVRLFWNNHPVPTVIVRQFTHEMRCDNKNLVASNLIPIIKGCQGPLIRSRASQPFSAEKYVGRRCPGSLPLRVWTFKHLLCWPGAMQNTRVKMLDWNVVNIILFCFKLNQHCWWGTPTNKTEENHCGCPTVQSYPPSRTITPWECQNARPCSPFILTLRLYKCPQTVESQIKRHPRRLT